MSEFTFTVNYKNGDHITLSDNLSWDNVDHEGVAGMTAKIGKSELFTLHLEEDQRLIYRKRNVETIGVPAEKNLYPVIYLIGWRQKVNGKDVQSITYICNWIGKGFQIHQAGKFREDHPWFYPPYLHIHEAWKGERYYDPKTQTFKTK